MKHKGLSGHAVELINNGETVRKWSQGPEATRELFVCMLRQKTCIQMNSLYPIQAVPIFSYNASHNSFYFEMPFMDLETGYTTSNFKLLECEVLESLIVRSRIFTNGFNGIVLKELSRVKNVDKYLIDRTKSMLTDKTDEYPYGYAHGDFGFANMLVGEKEIHMIDFGHPFIDSPLLDVAMLELSATKPEHMNIVVEAKRLFKNTIQIEILQDVHLIRALSRTTNLKAMADILECLS